MGADQHPGRTHHGGKDAQTKQHVGSSLRHEYPRCGAVGGLCQPGKAQQLQDDYRSAPFVAVHHQNCRLRQHAQRNHRRKDHQRDHPCAAQVGAPNGLDVILDGGQRRKHHRAGHVGDVGQWQAHELVGQAVNPQRCASDPAADHQFVHVLGPVNDGAETREMTAEAHQILDRGEIER